MKEILQAFFANYRANGGWDIERMERSKILLPQILEKVEGDILEIGAHRGASTSIFCEIAAKFGRTVYVIDPWDGRQEGNADIYNEFTYNTSSCTNLKVYRHGSESNEAINAVKNLKFAYILIDGLHGYDAVVLDFKRYRELINYHGVICIDDWTGPYIFCEQIQRAIRDNLTDQFYLVDSPTTLIERYVVRI